MINYVSGERPGRLIGHGDALEWSARSSNLRLYLLYLIFGFGTFCDKTDRVQKYEIFLFLGPNLGLKDIQQEFIVRTRHTG